MERFRPAYAVGYGGSPGGILSEQSLTLRRLRQASHALVEFENADSWVQLTDREERAALEELKPELLLPLSLNEKLLGIMSLGPKQSEEPFRQPICDCWIRWRRRRAGARERPVNGGDQPRKPPRVTQEPGSEEAVDLLRIQACEDVEGRGLAVA